MTLFNRYTTEAARHIWSNRTKYEMWTQIEYATLRLNLARARHQGKIVLATHAQTLLDVERCVLRNPPGPGRVTALEKTLGHEMGAFLFCLDLDLHTAPAARHWLHHGLTSSDVQDTTDMARCWRTSNLVQAAAYKLHCLLADREDLRQPVQGYTHGQPATPTTLANRLLAHAQPLDEQIPPAYGMVSGATGTRPVLSKEDERDILANLAELGWPQLAQLPYTTQVIPRQYLYNHARYWLNLLEVCEQLALDLRLLAAAGEVRLAPAEVGSSAMPHKVNPAKAEQICGLARIGRGLLGAMGEGKALWQDRDLTHSSVDRVALPALANLTHYALRETLAMWEAVSVPALPAEAFRGTSEGLLVALVDLTPPRFGRQELYRAVADATRHGEDLETACSVLAERFNLRPDQLRNRARHVIGWMI